MAKKFAPRVSKRNRKTIDLTERLGRDVFQASDDKLLKGAKLDEIQLSDINVKEQVRTKFNDASIKDLAANIESNGLIQPLVLHKTGHRYTLICGERRFRAMSLIEMEKAPCFVLENKSEEELMAIQFSENSSREALHYIDKADGIYSYQVATKSSERKIQSALGISKSEVHRSLLIAKMPKIIKEAAKRFDIEKYVLLEFDALETSKLKKELEEKILEGEITKRSQLKRLIKNGNVLAAGKKKAAPRKAANPQLSANALLKTMKTRLNSSELELDAKTKKMLKEFMKETKDIVDNY